MVSWGQAERMGHLVRPMDKNLTTFRCFHCNHWFDTQAGIEVNHNFNFIDTEVTWCSSTQLDMFE